MSLDKSFGKTKSLAGQRNVLNKIERLKLLKERGLWEEGDKVVGLPKEKLIKLKKIKTEKEDKPEPKTDWEVMRK